MDIRDCKTGEHVALEKPDGTVVTLCKKSKLADPIISTYIKLKSKTTITTNTDDHHFYKGWKCEFECVQPKEHATGTTVAPPTKVGTGNPGVSNTTKQRGKHD